MTTALRSFRLSRPFFSASLTLAGVLDARPVFARVSLFERFSEPDAGQYAWETGILLALGLALGAVLALLATSFLARRKGPRAAFASRDAHSRADAGYAASSPSMAATNADFVSGAHSGADPGTDLGPLPPLLEKAPPLVCLGPDGLVLWANPGAVALVKPRSGANMFSAFVCSTDARHVAEALNGKAALQDFVTRMYGPDEQIRDISLTLTPDADGQASRLAWLSDVSQWKRIEKALTEARCAAETANRAKNDFLARMSHEIRTPMNAILGMGYLCLQTKLNARQRDHVTKMQVAAQTLLGVINDILDFSTASDTGIALEHSAFHLDSFLHAVETSLIQRFEQRGLTYAVDVDPRIPNRLVGDALRISQVLQILLGNAVKFTDQGQVSLSIALDSEDSGNLRLHFSVTDSGIGIEPDKLSRLFQPFFQADDSSTRRYGGTGLGLAISKNLVERMGGSIWAESEAGQGSVFHFILPLGKAMRGPSEISVPGRDFRDMELLVVDDNISSMLALAGAAESLGFRVTSASSGLEALDIMEAVAARGRRFHVLLLDWKMDELDGIETAHLIQSAFPPDEVPLIVLVSASSTDIAEETLEEHAIRARLIKPVAPALLDATLRPLLGMPPAAQGKDDDDSLPASGAAPSAEENPENPLIGARVLLVEDNEINQEIALALLEGEGLRVDVANNGQEALDMVRNALDAYRLVFMDIQMPVMDGLSATRAIREYCGAESLPIVAMTAHGTESDYAESLEAGMNAHLIKPLDPLLLHEALLTWIKPLPLPAAEQTKQMEQADQAKRAAAPSLGTPQAKKGGKSATPERRQGDRRAASGRNPASLSSDKNAVPVLSREAGLENVGGNQTLYIKLLRKFYESCRASPQEITRAKQLGDNELAVRTAHTVRGISASLGMFALSQSASAMERHLQYLESGEPYDEDLLEDFAQALTLALGQVESYLEEMGVVGAAAQPQPAKGNAAMISPESAALALRQLERMDHNLESDWGEVMSAHDMLSNLLRDTVSASSLCNLTAAVENFDIAQIRLSLVDMEQGIRGSIAASCPYPA